MKNIRICAALMLLSLFSVSCRLKFETGINVYEGFALGTTFNIRVKKDGRQDLKPAVDSLLSTIERSMSVYDPSSLISRINRGETDSVDSYIADCIEIARQVSAESGGLYDITIKPLTEAYGFAGGNKAGGEPNIDSLLRLVGYEKISVDRGRIIKEDPAMQLDLNSVAKGYCVDVVARHFDSAGYENYLVEIGGEIFTRGTNMKGKPWVVGIDRPYEGNVTPGESLQMTIGLSGKGLATSGNYRKYYTDSLGRKIVHSISAATGEPVISNLLSATVIAETAALADAYGTFFMVAGLEKSLETLEKHPELAAYLIYSGDGGEYRVHATDNLLQENQTLSAR